MGIYSDERELNADLKKRQSFLRSVELNSCSYNKCGPARRTSAAFLFPGFSFHDYPEYPIQDEKIIFLLKNCAAMTSRD